MARKKRKRRGRYHRGEHVSTKSGRVFKYRSGWEQKVMSYLDSSSDVETWDYEQIVIEYVSNIRTKKIRRYYPDFYVKYSDGRHEVLEVKPKRKLGQAVIVKKVEAAKAWCAQNGMNFRLITEEDLRDMGLM